MGSRRIRAALLDFDGTIVREHLTSLMADVNGKREESDRLNVEFQSGRLPGVAALVERTKMLAGVTVSQIREVLTNGDYLMPGAVELFEYFRSEGITTILASGSMLPILQHYQRELSIDYIVGTTPTMSDDGETILGMSDKDAPVQGFKLIGCMSILTDLDIPVHETVAIGDSPADKGMLLHAGLGIAINPVGGVETLLTTSSGAICEKPLYSCVGQNRTDERNCHTNAWPLAQPP